MLTDETQSVILYETLVFQFIFLWTKTSRLPLHLIVCYTIHNTKILLYSYVPYVYLVCLVSSQLLLLYKRVSTTNCIKLLHLISFNPSPFCSLSLSVKSLFMSSYCYTLVLSLSRRINIRQTICIVLVHSVLLSPMMSFPPVKNVQNTWLYLNRMTFLNLFYYFSKLVPHCVSIL